MRTLVSIGFGVALMAWAAGRAFAAPPPFFAPQRAVPSPTALSLSGVPLGRSPHAAIEGVLHSFGSGADGTGPEGGLTYMNGVLYGTTCGGGKYGAGTVFAITTTGAERVLHDFGSEKDGVCPEGSLIDVNGILYGTTFQGGTHGFYACGSGGTVFSITTAGNERVIHNFDEDGANPMAGLIDVNGILYGTTTCGGQHGEGTVFAITTGGTVRILHSFYSLTGDGVYPQAPLIDVNGILYGTTSSGGSYNNRSGYGYGTVFSVTTAGTERIVHSFGNGTDGADPFAGLIDVNGVLYGTTYGGGKYLDQYGNGEGAIFALTTGGAESVLHNFGNGTDGANPRSSPVDVNGVLYGTTEAGGVYGFGTVFATTTAGYESVLRNFRACQYPQAELIEVNGLLYGTSQGGGTYHRAGTVFFQSP